MPAALPLLCAAHRSSKPAASVEPSPTLRHGRIRCCSPAAVCGERCGRGAQAGVTSQLTRARPMMREPGRAYDASDLTSSSIQSTTKHAQFSDPTAYLFTDLACVPRPRHTCPCNVESASTSQLSGNLHCALAVLTTWSGMVWYGMAWQREECKCVGSKAQGGGHMLGRRRFAATRGPEMGRPGKKQIER